MTYIVHYHRLIYVSRRSITPGISTEYKATPKLRKTRMLAGIGLNQLERDTGATNLSLIERGIIHTSPRMAAKIAIGLGLRLQDAVEQGIFKMAPRKPRGSPEPHKNGSRRR